MKLKKSNKPSIRWFAPATGALEVAAVARVVRSAYLNDGDVTREFERTVADFIGVRHCVAVTSGTTALTLALMGLGIGHGDEVIVPDLTFIATANAARMAGATVKLVDVEPRRFSIDVEALERAIGPRTRAIMPVDVNGRGADYRAIEAIARKRKLFVVCDAAEALGSRYGGKYLGTFGDAGCFSFSPNKTITTGQGGMIATNNTRLYHRLLELKDQGRRHQGTGGNDLHPVMGFNFKFTNLQAAVGLAQWTRFRERLKQAVRRERWYRELLSDVPGLRFPDWKAKDGEVLQWTDVLVERRAVVERALSSAGIGFRPFWFPLHKQKPYSVNKPFPVSVRVSAQGLWLPSVFNLTDRDARRVAGVIHRALA